MLLVFFLLADVVVVVIIIIASYCRLLLPSLLLFGLLPTAPTFSPAPASFPSVRFLYSPAAPALRLAAAASHHIILLCFGMLFRNVCLRISI